MWSIWIVFSIFWSSSSCDMIDFLSRADIRCFFFYEEMCRIYVWLRVWLTDYVMRSYLLSPFTTRLTPSVNFVWKPILGYERRTNLQKRSPILFLDYRSKTFTGTHTILCVFFLRFRCSCQIEKKGAVEKSKSNKQHFETPRSRYAIYFHILHKYIFSE